MVNAVFVLLYDPGDFIRLTEEKIFDRHVVRHRRSLGEVSHSQALPDSNFARVGLQFTGKDLQQRGLANTVISYKAELFALGDAKGYIPE
jgi:hypothetical protein